MKQIYKREPITHSLPSNYSDLDAINYQNLNAFKGLQVYDNPLIADQNSTYSCKNVYVDEHGNLTVRPALMPTTEMASALWKHVFADGNALYVTSDGSEYTLHTWTNETLKVPNLNNIAVESNDKKYLFTQQEHNVLYDITDGEFNTVTGVVLLDDPKNSDISHYNILNSVVRDAAPLSNTRSDSVYTIVSTKNLIVDMDAFIPLSASMYLVYKLDSESIHIRILEYVYNEWSEHTWTIQQLSGDIVAKPYFALQGSDVVCMQASFTEYTDTAGGAIRYTRNTISLTGNGIYHDEPDVPFIFEHPVGDYCKLCVSSQAVYLSYCVSGSDYNDVYVYRYAINGSDPLRAILPINPRSSNYVIGCDDNVTTIFSIKTHSYYHWGQSSGGSTGLAANTLITQNSPDIVAAYDTSTRTVYIGYYDKVISIPNIPSEYVDTIFTTTTSNTVTVAFNGWRQTYEINMTDGTVITYVTAGSIAANAFDGTVQYTWSNHIVIRKITYGEIYRSTEVIPVITDIDEKIITGFFLDSCWWFITEHSIFGTGVDSNGLQTVERFDPLKYFKISEKITGAMRVSDTSFWVFHSNGAYLIYKTALTLQNGTEYRWLYTATAKSKGCDFENALHTLPVSSNVITVTATDICNIVMRENVQSDERILVPITTQFAVLARQLLLQTESIKILDYKYLTIFCLNPVSPNGVVPTLVIDNATSSWWYWEFPVNKVHSIRELEEYSLLYCELSDGTIKSFKLSDDEYHHQLGILRYSIYADRLDNQSTEPTQIEWHWQSAVQLFGTIERRKQLLFTTFVFDDYAENEFSEQEIEIGYYFDIYSREYTTSNPDATTVPVYRVSNRACRTTIGSFNYLQLNVHNRELDGTNFEVLTKPKICCISMKYRILRGEI